MSTRLLCCAIVCTLLFTQPSISSGQTDTRAVKEQDTTIFSRLSSEIKNHLSPNTTDCILPGDMLTLEGQQLTNFSHYQLVLRNQRTYIPLKTLSLSDKKIILQIPRDTDLVPGQHYPIVMLLASEGANVSKPTGSSIKICPPIHKRNLLPIKESHENGEILSLSHSGLVDPLIKQASKNGYILLRRYQLNSLNQTLLVFGGAEKNLGKAIKSLSMTFPEAQIDYNHHFYTSESSQIEPLQHQKMTSPICHTTQNAKVTVGMLDGDIDLTHPALAGKSIKTKNFLLPGQPLEQEHATAIAALLVGGYDQNKFGGFVPFINLKAASVVRENEPTAIATAESISRAIDWFINEKVRLLNVSLTSPTPNKITNTMFTHATEQGLIIFAAAGNDGKRLTPAYPGVLPNVITITAVDAEGEIYSAANQGNYIDFAAPGVDIYTASSSEKGRYRSGTSLAVPHAVSIAAIYLANQPNYSQEALFQTLQHEAVDLGATGYDKRYGWGEVKINRDNCP